MIIEKVKTRNLIEQVDFVIQSIVELKPDLLKEVLNKEFLYDEVPFNQFMLELKERLAVFELLENTLLTAIKANCQECHCSRYIYDFKGNVTNDEFSLYIETDGKSITDLHYEVLSKSELNYIKNDESYPF